VVTAAVQIVDVIVVDDNSSDNSAVLAERAGAKVLVNPKNGGYEASLNRGVTFAMECGYRHVVTMDADGEHDPACLFGFREALRDRRATLVLGVRKRRNRWSEVMMGWYVQWRFGVHDILCGMKGFDIALVRMNGGLGADSSVGTALAINALRQGVPFTEVAVYGVPREGAPRFGSLVDANLRILCALWQVIRDDVAHAKQKLIGRASLLG
jgi:glycosyltransferase involved in cell wall biosynthesis